MAPGTRAPLLSWAVLACAPLGAGALRSGAGLARLREPGQRELPPGKAQLQCLVPSNAAATAKREESKAAEAQECGHRSRRLEHYTGTEALPLNGTWWAGGAADVYRPDRADIARALRPAGYAGARLRLRKLMLELAAGRPVEVSVLGGSMTFGNSSLTPWPAIFGQHMRSLGHELTVHNLAKPCTGSEYAATHIVHGTPELSRSGLVIIDTSINDWADWYQRPGQQGGSTDSYDLLVQELLELPQRPAVVELATMHMHGNRHVLPLQNSGRAVYCSSNLSDFPHARAEQFQLPIVSFPDAMCQCCGHDGLWFGELHPNATTHDAIARTLVAAFGMEMEGACQPDGLQVDDHPPLAQELQTAPFSDCLRLKKSMDVDFTVFESVDEGTPYAERHEGWQFARDLPTKPFGWMVPSGSPPGQNVSLWATASSGGWIRLDYLSTYEDIGSVTCWVDGTEPQQGCFIDPLQAGRFSAVRSAYIGLPSGLDARMLHCRSHGGKFKVLGISSC